VPSGCFLQPAAEVATASTNIEIASRLVWVMRRQSLPHGL
jgi:hypothetical protein